MRPPLGIVVAAAATLTGALAGGFVATAVSGPPPASAAPAVGVAADVHSEEVSGAPKTMTAASADAQESVPPATGQPAPAVERETAVEVAPAPVCPSAPTGAAGSAPSAVSPAGVAGTSTEDLAGFARAYNAIRIANCLLPVPPANFRYDSCMEARLFWMAEDPSTDTSSAWGHIGSVRSDGVPSVGCDGNLAGGMNNTGDTVARKWWESAPHRASLYKPDYSGSTASVCIYFAITHGGVPDEPAAFARAAARWDSC
jgi:uncharacterized protein YkwD